MVLNNNIKKIFYYSYYLFTLWIVYDFGSVLIRPFFLDHWPVLIFWNTTFEMYPLSWALAVIIITVAFLIRKK